MTRRDDLDPLRRALRALSDDPTDDEVREIMRLARTLVDGEPVFVFGSNLAGRHGKGAALEAREKHGAIYGQGMGLQGNSYAIPTKDEQLRPLSLEEIAAHVGLFILFAMAHPKMNFRVTRVGCGLAGYTESEIRPLFENAPPNCHFEWENP